MFTKNKLFFYLICLIFLSAVSLYSREVVLGEDNEDNKNTSETIENLKNKIASKNEDIKKVENEIKVFQKELENIGKEKVSLNSTIKELSVTEKKLSSSINLTEDQIETAILSIKKLDLEVDKKEDNFKNTISALSKALNDVREIDDRNVIEVVFADKKTSDLWDQVERLQQYQNALGTLTNRIKKEKADLEIYRNLRLTEKDNLVKYQKNLNDQKLAVSFNKQEKNNLLSETKNKESQYKQILTERKKLRDAFEKELNDYESQLSFTIDRSKLPKYGSGVLAWPLDFVKITQYFGKTEFAAKNPQVYSGMGHNGIDLKASIGTPIKSSASGKVLGTGNTDLACPRASYGKWILVEHENGLSTLYAHLSVISVSEGQSVGTGSIIGYSGNTGYSTGPHLHFTVYASQGVKIMKRSSRICSSDYTIPLADYKAYMNPLLYL